MMKPTAPRISLGGTGSIARHRKEKPSGPSLWKCPKTRSPRRGTARVPNDLVDQRGRGGRRRGPAGWSIGSNAVDRCQATLKLTPLATLKLTPSLYI